MSNRNSIFQVLENSLKLFPDHEAIYDGYRYVTYQELYREVECICGGLLKLGVKKGDRIIVCLPNCREYVVIYFALAKLGAILIPCDSCYQNKEWKKIFQLTTVKVVFCSSNDQHLAVFMNEKQKQQGMIEHIITVRFSVKDLLSFTDLLNLGENTSSTNNVVDTERDVFTILYTSGSTGKAKGVMLTHDNFVYSAKNVVRGLQCDESDCFLVSVPFSHVFGLIPGILTVIMSGGKMVIVEKFHADQALKLMKKEKVTVHFGVPTMFILELNDPYFEPAACSSLRTGLIAGAPCPEQIIKRIHAEMGCNIIVSYGATETSGGVTYTNFADNASVSSKTVGKVIEGTQIKIVDENRQEVPMGTVGELSCRGKGIMKGYFQMPEVTQKAVDDQGWFYTGDLAKMDDQGYITIVERKKNMIIRGGYNVYPRDIEEIFFTHPRIATAAVVGIPDTVLGEVICAVIKLNSANYEETADAMKNFIRERAAKYKVPDHILFVESFPLTPTGKIDKKTLSQICENQLKAVLR